MSSIPISPKVFTNVTARPKFLAQWWWSCFTSISVMAAFNLRVAIREAATMHSRRLLLRLDLAVHALDEPVDDVRVLPQLRLGAQGFGMSDFDFQLALPPLEHFREHFHFLSGEFAFVDHDVTRPFQFGPFTGHASREALREHLLHSVFGDSFTIGRQTIPPYGFFRAA
jgi:hypothetical protein